MEQSLTIPFKSAYVYVQCYCFSCGREYLALMVGENSFLCCPYCNIDNEPEPTPYFNNL